MSGLAAAGEGSPNPDCRFGIRSSDSKSKCCSESVYEIYAPYMSLMRRARELKHAPSGAARRPSGAALALAARAVRIRLTKSVEIAILCRYFQRICPELREKMIAGGSCILFFVSSVFSRTIEGKKEII